MKTVASSVRALFSFCGCTKIGDNVIGMAADSHVYYVMTEDDDDTIQTVVVPRETTVKSFFELLNTLKNVDKQKERLRVLDYQGCLVLPSSFPLPVNTPDTPYAIQVIPKSAFYYGELSEDFRMDLTALENRITDIEKVVANDDSSINCVQGLKIDFQSFRSKLENGSFVTRINPSMEISPAHRKLKYRRLSDTRQKEVRKRFIEMCSNETLSEEIMQCLRLPSFDCSEWADEEILLILQQMFIDFDFITKFKINLDTLRNFLFQVYKNYNEVPFHNFRHSFCVTQMMYAMILKVDLMRLIGDLEILVLITSCICHDLDHPGFNNIYQINARTELAIRYNDISPLENHHCSMAFRILDLPDCNIFENCDSDLFRTIREGIIRCILATDMARHNEILAQFRDAMEDGFDFSNRVHINLLCMVLIKVADISNEARPMNVAEPWLDKLFKEFFAQSDAEKKEGLPITPFMDRDKITKPSSQCSFIGFVLLPLFESLGQLFPDLEEMIVQPVRDALEYYRKLNEMAKDEQRQQRKSVVTLETCSSNQTSPSSPAANSANNNATLMVSDLSNKMRNQRSQEEVSLSESFQELDEEEEEEETVTEVAVSEKTLKFKISTESFLNFSSGSKSHPGSRKGSREKGGQDFEISRSYRYERSNRTSDSGADKRSWSSSENTSSADDKSRSENCNIPERIRHHSMFCANTSIPECSLEHLTSISSAAAAAAQNDRPSQSPVDLPPTASTSSSSKTTAETPTAAEQQSKQPPPSTSNRNSPDLKRLMNRVVRDLRGGSNRSKILNGVKSEESTTSKEEKVASSKSSQQHKESKSPSWMSSLFQNIKLRSSSHDSDNHT